MEFFSSFTDALDESRLDVHMDILKFHGPDKVATFDIGEDALQAGNDVSALGFADNTGMRQHARMCNGAGDIMPVESLVEADRGGKGLDESVCRFREASAPGFFCSVVVCHVGNRNACFAAV